MANFEFLKNDYPNLFLLCSDVDKYMDSDKSVSMLKARQAIEYIVKYLGADTDDLFVNINNLEDKNIANSRIIDLFHLIRKKANKSVHNNYSADTEGVMDALIEICVWLAVGYDKNSISIIKYTDKEKFFLKKYGNYEVGGRKENYDVSDTINPLEAVGKFSNENIETSDILEQDVFETYEEYCKRIESMPAIKIGYAFLDPSQIDDYCEIAFPLFHISKHPKISSSSVSAFYVADIDKSKSVDGIIKAKLKIFKNKIYYDYDSVTLQDEDNKIKLFPISWEKYGYETVTQFANRLRELPLIPVAIAKPIRKEYNLKKQSLPFETISLNYASKVFAKKKIECLVDRDNAKSMCSIVSPFRVYAHFKDLQTIDILQISNTESDKVLTIIEEKTIINNHAESKVKSYSYLAKQGNADAQYNLARSYEYSYGVKENRQEALKWYAKAAEKGKVIPEEENERLLREAERGNYIAQYKLAKFYEDNSLLLNKEDMKEAFKWYTKSAEQGYAEAQFCLAECYSVGIGTEWNFNKALDWYKKAAEQGHERAQDMLELFTKE